MTIWWGLVRSRWVLICSFNFNPFVPKAKCSPVDEVDEEDSQPKPPEKRKVKADEELVKARKSTSTAKTSSKGTKGKQVPKSSVSSSGVSSHRSHKPPSVTIRLWWNPKVLKAKLQLESDILGLRQKKLLKFGARTTTYMKQNPFRKYGRFLYNACIINDIRRSQKVSKTKNSASRSVAITYKSAVS